MNKKEIARKILEKYEDGLYKDYEIVKTKKINSELFGVYIKNGNKDEGWITLGQTFHAEVIPGLNYGVYDDVPVNDEEFKEQEDL